MFVEEDSAQWIWGLQGEGAIFMPSLISQAPSDGLGTHGCYLPSPLVGWQCGLLLSHTLSTPLPMAWWDREKMGKVW